MKKMLIFLLTFLLILTTVVGCTQEDDAPEDPGVVEDNDDEVDETDEGDEDFDGTEIILATTTSTEDSGLLDFLLPIFKEDTGIEVKTVSVGTGQALQMGRDGDADVLLVHAKDDELEMLDEGHATEREDVMYNDFILVGPADGTVADGDDITAALTQISDEGLEFVSRGDDSGTHKKELNIWSAADIEPSGDWYIEAGQGMGDVLSMADEKQAYTIADRATYLSMQDNLDLAIVVEGDENLFNQYGVLPVNPDKNDSINNEAAVKFLEWLISDKGQELISEFGVEEYGEALFIPNN